MPTATPPNENVSNRPTRFRRMMNIFDLSLSMANIIFAISNVALIIGGVLVLVGTIGAFGSTSIKERYADERASNNEAETARANEAAALAKERAAVAEQRASESALELERLKAPRHLNPEKSKLLLSALQEFAGTPFDMAYQQSDPEAESFLAEIQALLLSAGWVALDWDNAGAFGFVGRSSTGKQVGFINQTGISIHVHPSHLIPLDSAGNALCSDLLSAGIDARRTVGPVQSSHLNAIHVLVGKKAN